MKVGIYGNCQAPGFAKSIEALAPGCTTHVYRINDARNASDDKLDEEFELLVQCDILFTQPSLGQTAGRLTPELLASSSKRHIAYPHIAFTGLQPDCHYIRPGGVPINGPMGPYHSAIVAASFLEGISPERSANLFHKFAYACLGYLASDLSHQTMVREERRHGYDFSAFTSGSRGKFMHTVNHPAISIIFESARQALEKAGVETEDAAPPDDALARQFSWPLYREIGQRWSIADAEPFVFRAPDREMTGEEFITASYDAYREIDPLLIATDQIAEARRFIREYVKI
jgi:hypothetical protein